MDKNKLDISGGKTETEAVPASYKPIPEKDMEDDAVSQRPKSLAKIKNSLDEKDGADEKMLAADEKEVAIYNSEKSPQNGDAKLDIDDIKQAFVGLTKEELMKYANDPFWVRLRWFLFITFWVLWAAMLVGAVLIIYAAPKCDPPPPRTWYQQGPIAKIETNTKPETVQHLHKSIQGVIIEWPGDAYAPLEDHLEIGTLVKTARESGTNVILELEPAVSSLWFEKSETKDPDYEAYYIWRPGSNKGRDSPTPPNNWVSKNNISSWKYSDKRKEFYYAPFEKPHLNFRNQSVIQEFSRVIERFLSANISGIRLRNAAFLLVDSDFADEDLSQKSGAGLTEYAFYTHTKTENLPELGTLLKSWRNLIRNKTDNGPLMIAEELGSVEAYKINETLVVDMPLQSYIFSKPVLSVNETANSLNYTFNIDNVEWPLWEASTTAVPKDAIDIVTYLLPGAPLVNASSNISSELIKIRDSPSIMRGICGVYNLQNNSVLAFIRVTPGNPGILVALNPTEYSVTINIPAEIPPLAELQEVTVKLYSSNYNETAFRDIGAKKEANAVPISAKSALVLDYVPKKKE